MLYYQDNRARILADKAEYYQRNKSVLVPAARKYRSDNKEEISSRDKARYAQDGEYRNKARADAKNWITKNYRSWLLRQVKLRAKKDNIPFDLTVEDIVVPELCPVLGIKLERGIGSSCDTSPTVDRIIASKGYVKGNVAVISRKANSMKGGASADEHRRIAEWMETMINV